MSCPLDSIRWIGPRMHFWKNAFDCQRFVLDQITSFSFSTTIKFNSMATEQNLLGLKTPCYKRTVPVFFPAFRISHRHGLTMSLPMCCCCERLGVDSARKFLLLDSHLTERIYNLRKIKHFIQNVYIVLLWHTVFWIVQSALTKITHPFVQMKMLCKSYCWKHLESGS